MSLEVARCRHDGTPLRRSHPQDKADMASACISVRLYEYTLWGSLPSRVLDTECTLIGEKRRRAACVQEDDVLVLPPTSLPD